MQWLGSVPSLTSLLGIPSPEEAAGGPKAASAGDLESGRGGPLPSPSSPNPAASAASAAWPAASGGGSGGGEPQHEFAVGAFVEYNSASQGAWIPAKVVALRPNGAYDLDCKPGVQAAKVRAPQSPVPEQAPGPQEYEVRAFVEYFSESRGGWIPARVTGYNAQTGAYDLDCKPAVQASKIRHPAPRERQTSPSAVAGLDPIEEHDENEDASPAATDDRPTTPAGGAAALGGAAGSAGEAWLARQQSPGSAFGASEEEDDDEGEETPRPGSAGGSSQRSGRGGLEEAQLAAALAASVASAGGGSGHSTPLLGGGGAFEPAPRSGAGSGPPSQRGGGGSLPASRHGSQPASRQGSLPASRQGSLPASRHGSQPSSRRGSDASDHGLPEAIQLGSVVGGPPAARDDAAFVGASTLSPPSPASPASPAAWAAGSRGDITAGGSSGSGSGAGRRRARSPGADAAAEGPMQDAPLQLVRVLRRGDSWHFEVCEEAARVLESYGQRPVSVCTVCGPYRTGKSFLLNLLLGRMQRGVGRFRVGSTSRACTEGLWMWGAASNGLFFVDCEGFGSTESDRVRDAKLMSLCMLVSSVFVLNTKGVLNEGLFNALSLVCSLAEHIDDQGGGEASNSRPALLWLLRDFLLELRDEDGRPISSDEYLEKALRARPAAGVDASRAQGARQVRETLTRFFPQRQCSTLVQPVVDEDVLQRLGDAPYQELRPEFRSAFEAAQARLLALARAAPKTVGGQPLGGAALVALLRRLVDALNSNSMLHMGSAWEQVQHSACAALAQELLAKAQETFARVRAGESLPAFPGRALPVRDDVLARGLREARRELKEEWRARAIGDPAVREEYWKEFRADLLEGEQALEQLNAQQAEEQLRAAGADWEAWLTQEGEAASSDPRSEALPQLFDRGLPARPVARAAREALHGARMARIRWDSSLDALKAELRLTSAELASRTSAAQAAKRLDDATLETTREAGRLQGQVDALQTQARESIQREKVLREQVLDAEEATRKEQRSHGEAKRRCKELEESAKRLEAQVTALKEAERARREAAAEEELRAKDRPVKPKCGCTVM